MIVTGWNQAGKVSITYNEFDGVTSWSSSCNGQHYWTLLLLGLTDYYTFAGNYIHDCSGRAPHFGTDYDASEIFFHGVNNYFENMGGHAFDIDVNTWALLEGNYFYNVDTPMTPGSTTSGANIYTTITVDEAGACADYLDYICEWEKTSDSGTLYDIADTSVLTKASLYAELGYLVGHVSVSEVASNVTANAGIGKV